MAPTFFLQQVVKQQNHKQMTKACIAYKLWILKSRGFIILVLKTYFNMFFLSHLFCKIHEICMHDECYTQISHLWNKI
jgi:hypothetical protein